MFAIAGVTGNTGAAAASALLAAGEKVRVIVRRPDAGSLWRERGAEVAVAGLDDARALADALAGCHGAYWLNPPAYAAADAYATAAQRARAFRHALAAAAIDRAVVLSSVGAHRAAGTGIIRTSHLVEEELGDAATPLTFIRGRYFFENWAAVLGAVREHGVLPTFLAPIDRRIEMVTTDDIGAQVAALLRGPGWPGRRAVELSSFAASPAEVAAAFGTVLGRSVSPTPVPREQWAGILGSSGFTPPIVAAFVEMYDGIIGGVVVPEPGAAVAAGTTGLASAARRLLAR